MSNRDEINNNIYNLQYSSDEVLKFNGNMVTNFVKYESEFDNNNFIVKTRTLNAVDGNYDIAVPNAYQSIAYVGSLILGNSKLVDGSPQPLVTGRNPMNFTVDLPGMTIDNSFVVDDPSYGNVLAAINGLLNRWLEKYQGEYEIPANLQMQSSIVSDEKQMSLKFGCDVKFLTDKLGIDFNAIAKKEKSVYLVQYKQIYYTVSAESPKQPSDVFSDDVTWDVLQKKGVNNSNPPMYIENVQYGREIYIKFESELSDYELSAALSGKITTEDGLVIDPEASASGSVKYKDIKCNLIALGGSTDVYSGILDSADFIDKINKIIFENAKLSEKNPAYPLCYLPVFLKDNCPSNIVGHTEYVTESVETYSGGELNLKHHGWYVARFNVSWDEINYDEKGVLQVTKCYWPDNGNNKTAPYETVISLKGNTRNINIKAEGNTGLVWDLWRTSVDKTNLAMVPSREVYISGTTLSQEGSVNPE